MDPREKISNHLTAHGVSLEIIGGRGADIAEVIRGMDFAMLLGMIEPRQAGMLLAKYADDRLEERKCRAWWLMECLDVAKERNWKRGKPHMVEGLAYATMNEHMGRGTVCAVCNGTKEREINRKIVQCWQCEGKGMVLYLPEVYADRIGCTLDEYWQAWGARVDWARRALHQWETDAAEALRAKLGT